MQLHVATMAPKASSWCLFSFAEYTYAHPYHCTYTYTLYSHLPAHIHTHRGDWSSQLLDSLDISKKSPSFPFPFPPPPTRLHQLRALSPLS